MKALGFSGSASARVLCVILYGLAASASVLLLETRPASARTPQEAKSVPAPSTIRVVAESTFAVSEWHVTLGGEPVDPQHFDLSHWEGVVEVASDVFLVVEARSEDYFSDFGHAVSLRLIQGPHIVEEVHWGRGDVAILRKLGTEDASDE